MAPELVPFSPLAGIRVLSLAEQYPGPLATLILADLGADVILVERPAGGDPTRRFTGHFEALNRNKRSVALDLKTADGIRDFHALAATADVLVEGFKPGVMARLGLSAVDLKERYPALIYTSISSYGHSGPLSPRGGHDLSMQGRAGFVTGEPPAPAPLPLADLASGMYAAIGVLAALLDRGSSVIGSGVHVDVSMLDALIAWRQTSLVSSLNGLAPAPYPPLDPGYGVFAVGDTGMLVTLSIAGEDHQWRELCEVLGLADVAGLTTEERENDRDRLIVRLTDAFAAAEGSVVDVLADRGVGAGLVNDDVAAASDPQVAARGMLVDVGDDAGVRVVRQPVLFNGRPTPIARRAPELGEHTEALLADVRATR